MTMASRRHMIVAIGGTIGTFALRSTCHHTVSFGCGGADAYIILCSGFLMS